MRIGDLATQAGLTTKTIRFYEQTGLIPEPPRTSSGYRDYPSSALGQLSFIRHAQAAGFTLAEIRAILAIRDSGHAPCEHVTSLIARHLAQVNQRIAELTETRVALAALQRRAAGTDPANCTHSDICTILAS